MRKSFLLFAGILLSIFMFCTGCGLSPRMSVSGAGDTAYFPVQVFPVPHTMEYEIKERIASTAHRKSVLGFRISGERLDAPKIMSLGKGLPYYLEKKAAWNAMEEGEYDGIYVVRTIIERGGVLPPIYRVEEAKVYGFGIRILSFDRVDDVDRQDSMMNMHLVKDELERKGILSALFTPFRYILAPLFPFLLFIPDET